jgi:hypothetical protein
MSYSLFSFDFELIHFSIETSLLRQRTKQKVLYVITKKVSIYLIILQRTYKQDVNDTSHLG